MKKIIITGVSGQVGSYMAEYCLKLGHEVFGVTRRTSTPNDLNFKHLLSDKNFHQVYADLTDSTSIEEMVENILPDYFINLAAQSSVSISLKSPHETFNVDTIGVIRCLDAIKKFNINCRFYNAGSSEQFGNVKTSPQTELHPFEPRNPYGVAKCAAHNIIKIYRDLYHMYVVQGISYNHDSERRGIEFVTRKITLGVSRISNELKNHIEPIPIELGNFDARRDWSHVEDFVDCIWRMLNQEKYNEKLGGIETMVHDLSKNIKDYVISSGETHTIREFVELSFDCAGIDGMWFGSINGDHFTERFVFVDGFVIPDYVLVKINPKFYRPDEPITLVGDSTSVKTELGWNPKISFDQLVCRMTKNDLTNVVIK